MMILQRLYTGTESATAMQAITVMALPLSSITRIINRKLWISRVIYSMGLTAVLADAPSAKLVSEKPVLSASEVIQSFLSAHNIRWGELIAGVLIVVCSIGLVISLWSPLVEKHRVVPSLIFLGANSAIYAAGLYTLARWRLRHTSRAVLVIATLLVPLSVLAGLAAAGLAAILRSLCQYILPQYQPFQTPV